MAKFSIWLIAGFLVISVSLCAADDPRGNVNLSPDEQWISVRECLRNTSQVCPSNYTLTLKGWMNLTNGDTSLFCKGGCAQHTVTVLNCIHDVMRRDDIRFGDKSRVKDINYTISQGCATGFNGKFLYSGGKRMESSKIANAASLSLIFGLIIYDKLL